MLLANLLIALREGLEASLVVGILVAYLVKVGRRDVLPRLWAGIAIAAAVPLLLGAVLTFGPQTLTFQAQEILGGTLSLVAVALTTGMIFWMSSHARAMKSQLEGGLRAALERGGGWGIVLIAVMAVGREGLETGLLVWATVRSSVEQSRPLTTAGIVIGFAIAIVLGLLIYRGALRLNLSTFFTGTGLLLIVVAAGITSYAIGDFQEAGVLPGITHHAWDLSHLLTSTASPLYWAYVVLNAMFQVSLAPTVLQVIAWWAYLVPVLAVFLLRLRGSRRPRPAAATATAPAAAAAASATAAPAALPITPTPRSAS
ncbi:FTR1 family protein [Brachybacterium sp. JHP9]|uniref:FTR1 family protein n=1 Tax=Brachybacterium equifaecis TaxID=2910770 RepID=A0ABT0QZH3_9MICO|nr:iron uptake transporter permease EfeU [Brachybacterium equifaecis]MCL6423047.1 FTR1 family protein [Brachybacterium equifaecis]